MDERDTHSEEAAYEYLRRTGRWPSHDETFTSELPQRDRPIVHSKPTTNARPPDAPNYATVDERGVETPVDIGKTAHPPAE